MGYEENNSNITGNLIINKTRESIKENKLIKKKEHLSNFKFMVENSGIWINGTANNKRKNMIRESKNEKEHVKEYELNLKNKNQKEMKRNYAELYKPIRFEWINRKREDKNKIFEQTKPTRKNKIINNSNKKKEIHNKIK